MSLLEKLIWFFVFDMNLLEQWWLLYTKFLIKPLKYSRKEKQKKSLRYIITAWKIQTNEEFLTVYIQTTMWLFGWILIRWLVCKSLKAQTKLQLQRVNVFLGGGKSRLTDFMRHKNNIFCHQISHFEIVKEWNDVFWLYLNR